MITVVRLLYPKGYEDLPFDSAPPIPAEGTWIDVGAFSGNPDEKAFYVRWVRIGYYRSASPTKAPTSCLVHLVGGWENDLDEVMALGVEDLKEKLAESAKHEPRPLGFRPSNR